MTTKLRVWVPSNVVILTIPSINPPITSRQFLATSLFVPKLPHVLGAAYFETSLDECPDPKDYLSWLRRYMEQVVGGIYNLPSVVQVSIDDGMWDTQVSHEDGVATFPSVGFGWETIVSTPSTPDDVLANIREGVDAAVEEFGRKGRPANDRKVRVEPHVWSAVAEEWVRHYPPGEIVSSSSASVNLCDELIDITVSVGRRDGDGPAPTVRLSVELGFARQLRDDLVSLDLGDEQ